MIYVQTSLVVNINDMRHMITQAFAQCKDFLFPTTRFSMYQTTSKQQKQKNIL